MAVAFIVLSGCSYNSAMYEITKEQTDMVNSVPKWFMADYSSIKECGDGEKDLCIFGAGTSVSPDLNLAIEKAKMIAKSELADIIKGEMNKSSKQFITEIGETNNKSNKMYNYTVEEAVNAYVSKKTGSPATSSWEELMMNEDEDNSIQ